MPKICYVDKNFREPSLALINQANSIIREYRSDGFDLTLRQLYYQFVARGLIENSQREYNKLGNVINDGRLAGLVDWYAIVDRTRNLKGNSHWNNAAQIIEAYADWFAVDKWEGQAFHVEVWVEKEALAGVIGKVCSELDIDHFACRGYVSQSEMWVAGNRLEDAVSNEKQPVIIHLGDHDPSGIDMTRDIIDRLNMFLKHSTGEEIQVDRIALNMDQVDEYNPPPNPAKLTDSRCKDYVSKFGDESWELDALDPKTLSKLITDQTNKYLDVDKFNEQKDEEDRQKFILQGIALNWNRVTEFVEEIDYPYSDE